MTDVKYIEMEDIAYKEWSDHLDFVANSHANPWLPAYGCHSTSPMQEIIHGQSESFFSDNSSGQQYLVLETIVEETSDDLCNESDKSGPLGWNSDSDTDSVIHRPQLSECGKDGRKQDFLDEVPKKRRRRIFDKLSYSDDDEPQENTESTSLSSRSSSLIAFESLEKHCEDAIATASRNPFDRTLSSEATRWNFARSPDSLGEVREGSESSEEEHGFNSSGDTLERSHSSQSSFRFSHLNDTRLETYGSLDSLNLLQSPPPISYTFVELSQSQNALDKEIAKQQEQDLVIRDKKLTATTADLTNMTDATDSFFPPRHYISLLRNKQDKSSFHYKEPSRIRNCSSSASDTVNINDCFLHRGKKMNRIQELKTRLRSAEENAKEVHSSSIFPRSHLSAENLSEDSGIDDIGKMTIKRSVSNNKENEESSHRFYSEGNTREEKYLTMMVKNVNSKFVNKNAPSSKLFEKNKLENVIMTESPTVENDVEVIFNSGQNQTHIFDCSGAKEELFKRGEVEKLIATPSVKCAVLSSDDLNNDVYSESELESFSLGDKSNYFGWKNRRVKTGYFRNDEFGVKTKTDDFLFETVKKMSAKSDKKKIEKNRSFACTLPVLSTPNLFVGDEEFVRNVPSAASSLTHVPLKCYDDEVEKEELKNSLFDFKKSKLSSEFGGSENVSGIKGVHFCPVVSEVSWQDSYSEDNSSAISSDPSTDEISNRSLEDLCGMEYDDEECHEVEEKSIPRDRVVKFTEGSKKNNCQEIFSDSENVDEQNSLGDEGMSRKTMSEVYPFNEGEGEPKHNLHSVSSVKELRKDSILSNVNSLSDKNKAYVEKKPVTPTFRVTPTSLGHVFASDAAQPYAERSTRLSVSESSLPIRDHESDKQRENNCFSSSSVAAPLTEMTMKKSKSRLGGFFERFSFRRLSNRKSSKEISKKQNEKKDEKREKDVGIGAKTRIGNSHEDVTIIPLHGPENEAEVKEIFRSVVTPLVVSAKPPLPPNIQRMSGGSRKRSSTSGTVSVGLQNDETDEEESMPGIQGNPMANECTNNLLIGNVESTTNICNKPVGLLETDLDTHITVESAGRRPLVQGNVGNNKKARSLMNLGLGDMSVHHDQQQNMPSGYLEPNSHRSHGSVDDRAKSMEFLLDKENQAAVLPPENELQKGGPGERVMSEHQLRVQRSLQKLNIPDWYKASALSQTPQGFLLKRNSDSKREHQGWPGLGSKTTSLSSLGSSHTAAAKSPTGHMLSPSPTPHLFTRWSTSRLNSGWNSSSTSPSGSARSSFNYRQPYLGWRSQEKLTRPRTPAERLAAGFLPFQKQSVSAQQNSQTSLNPNLSDVRTSIKEVTSAIVHYVSGVQENGSRETLRNHQAEASPDPSLKWQSSPRGSSGKLCWLESSFVGSQSLDQPETPLGLTDAPTIRPETKSDELYLDLKPHPGIDRLTSHKLNEDIPTNVKMCEQQQFEKVFEIRSKPSPASTTLDDVLESLLGLPPTSRSPSPGPLSIASAAASSPGRSRPLLPLPDRQHQRFSCGDIRSNISGSASDPGNDSLPKATMVYRRKSEGGGELALTRQGSSEPLNKRCAESSQNQTGRDDVVKREVHMPLTETFVKCRYSKCGKTATVLDAKRTFKTCHNCSHVYCSRECRRAHWERHKRTCLHSRVGALCRQVLATAKEDAKTLHHLSLVARRGYLTHGRGAVKVFFSSPELAEKFVSRGFDELGEPVFVKWSDLLPAEMGADLFADLMRICKSYNPDTRLVLYVAICVLSEVPTTGAVKWERQLVSRCCKIQLEKSQIPSRVDKQVPPPLPPRRSSSDCVDITRELENQETLILTSLSGIAGKISEQKSREISFTNIQRELKQRGVSLRRQFPEVYKKLCSYVEGTTEHFTPVTIYPRAAVSGKTFMCIIMPDSEPEKLERLPKDSSRVQTVDISIEQKLT